MASAVTLSPPHVPGSATSPRVLVADVAAGQTTVQNVLGREATIIEANSLEKALAELKEGVSLVICGLHFDESRMFDLLRMANRSCCRCWLRTRSARGSTESAPPSARSAPSPSAA